MNDIKFKPVILGIDVGAYSVARTFYEFYNVKSIIIGKYTYWMTNYSKITETYTVDGMKEDKLIDYLVDLKKQYPDTKLLLFGCSEFPKACLRRSASRSRSHRCGRKCP